MSMDEVKPYDELRPKVRLNMEEMIVGFPNKLRFVQRYSTVPMHHPDNVLCHVGGVCVYAYLIGVWVEQNGVPALSGIHPPYKTAVNFERLNWNALFAKASMHDVEESKTGDIPRFFKYSSQELSDSYEKAAQKAMFQIAAETFSGENCADARADMIQPWSNAKDDSLEGRIVAFADFLSVVSILYQEAVGGNQSISEQASDIGEYYDLFFKTGYEFLRPLVVDLKPFIETIQNA